MPCFLQVSTLLFRKELNLQKIKMGRSSSLKNTVIAFLAALPSIFFYLSFLNHHYHGGSSSSLWVWCYHHPFLLANALFFLNVVLLFWVFSLIQSSHWVGPSLSVSSISLVVISDNHTCVSWSCDSKFGCFWYCRWLICIGWWYLWCWFISMQLIPCHSSTLGGQELWHCWPGFGVLGWFIPTWGGKTGNWVQGKTGDLTTWDFSMGRIGGGFPSFLSISLNRYTYQLITSSHLLFLW